MIFPTAPEVCHACENKEHVLHIISELGNLVGQYETHIHKDGRTHKVITLSGYAEDELFLEDLMRVISLEYRSRNKL
jgi:hypothetical protein